MSYLPLLACVKSGSAVVGLDFDGLVATSADFNANRLTAAATHLLSTSMVTEYRPSAFAAAAVLPEPPKQSSTISVGLELVLIMCSRRSAGFSAGCFPL